MQLTICPLPIAPFGAIPSSLVILLNRSLEMKDVCLIHIGTFSYSILNNVLFSDEKFERMITDHTFRNALFISSPDLACELDRYFSGKMTKKSKIERLISGLLKYIERMSTRCTPFGYFASCATIELADIHNLLVSNNIRENYRIDMLCLYNLAQILQSDNEFWHHRSGLRKRHT